MRKGKELLLLLPAAGVIGAAAAGINLNVPVFEAIRYPQPAYAAVEKKEEPPQEPVAEEEEPEEKAQGNYEDGVYEGTGTGYSGDVTVRVTVEGGQITNIEILETSDDAAFFNRAKALIDIIIQKQTWEVDAISGATYSSRGILEAVKNALTGSNEKSEVAQEENTAPIVTETYTGTAAWNDGVYTGSGTGFGGTISVSVTIQDGRITDITVTDHSGETPSYYNRAAAIIDSIISAQSPNVDTVSGATYSSNGIRTAVIQALLKASANGSGSDTIVDPLPQPEKPGPVIPIDPVVVPDGTPKDGTYTVSVVCEPDEDEAFEAYTLSADVTFKDGRLVSMENFTATDESNKRYYTWAAEGRNSYAGVVSQLVSLQTADGIDAVGGATCSSKAICDLYAKALAEAAGTPVEEEPEKPSGGDLPEEPDDPSKGDESENPPKEDTPDNPPGGDEPENPDQPSGGDGTENPPNEDDAENPSDGEDEPEVITVTVHVEAPCDPDEYQDFESYMMCADFVFENGVLTAINDLSGSDISNKTYYERALNGTKKYPGIASQLFEGKEEIDLVSGATCSSSTLLEMYELAYEEMQRVMSTETPGEEQPGEDDTENPEDTENPDDMENPEDMKKPEDTENPDDTENPGNTDNTGNADHTTELSEGQK